MTSAYLPNRRGAGLEDRGCGGAGSRRKIREKGAQAPCGAAGATGSRGSGNGSSSGRRRAWQPSSSSGGCGRRWAAGDVRGAPLPAKAAAGGGSGARAARAACTACVASQGGFDHTAKHNVGLSLKVTCRFGWGRDIGKAHTRRCCTCAGEGDDEAVHAAAPAQRPQCPSRMAGAAAAAPTAILAAKGAGDRCTAPAAPGIAQPARQSRARRLLPAASAAAAAAVCSHSVCARGPAAAGTRRTTATAAAAAAARRGVAADAG